MNIFKEQKGVIAIAFAILAPVIFAIIYLAFDGLNIISKKTAINNALRESVLANSNVDNPFVKDRIKKAFYYFYLPETNTIDTDFGGISSAIGSVLKIFNLDFFSEKLSDYNVIMSDLVKIEKTSTGDKTVSVKGKKILRDIDFAFVIDYSGSMFENEIKISSDKKKDDNKSLSNVTCNKKSKLYDKEFCNEIKFGSHRGITRMKATQAILKKVIRDFDKNENKNVRYAFIPFAYGSQLKKDFYYKTKNGTKKAEGVFFTLQVALKSKYAQSTTKYKNGYDDFSGLYFANTIGKDPRNYEEEKYTRSTFDLDPYYVDRKSNVYHVQINESRESQKRAEKFVSLLYDDKIDKKVIQTVIYNKLPNAIVKAIDYKKTFKDMFDLDKAFSFRYLTPKYKGNDEVFIDTDDDIIDSNYRPHGIVYYDYYCNNLESPKECAKGSGDRYKKISDVAPTKNNGIGDVYEVGLKDTKDLAHKNKIISYLNYKPKTEQGFYAGTLIASGMLRGAAYLAQGYNKKKILIVVTDGQSTERIKALEDGLLERGMCEKIKSGLKRKTGADDTEIYLVGIGDNNLKQDFIDNWESCTGSHKTIVIDNLEDFLDIFRNFTSDDEIKKVGKEKTKFSYPTYLFKQ